MKIQGNLINNYSYRKSDKSKKPLKSAENKIFPEGESTKEDEKAEAARIKKEELAAAAGELKKAAERRFGAVLEIFRRISRGDKVSPKDESALMEYDMKLYISAKSAAMMANSKKIKNHKKSLIEELEKAEKKKELKKAEDKASGEDSKVDNTEKSRSGAKAHSGVSFDISV